MLVNTNLILFKYLTYFKIIILFMSSDNKPRIQLRILGQSTPYELKSNPKSSVMTPQQESSVMTPHQESLVMTPHQESLVMTPHQESLEMTTHQESLEMTTQQLMEKKKEKGGDQEKYQLKTVHK